MAPAASSSSHARRLSSIFSSSTPRAQPPKPAPIRKAAAGEAGSKARREVRKPLGKILHDILGERDPDKLVSEFVAASTLPRFRIRIRVYEAVVSRLANLGRRDAVTAIIDAQKPFLDASTGDFAARLVGLYGRASMPSHAAATFRDLPPKHKSVATFNALLAAYVDAGDFDAVASAFQEIPASHPTIVPSVYSYNILISALCRKANLSAALDAVVVMEKCGILPDMISFNTLLNGFYNNGRFDDAEKVWEMMKARNLEPDAKSYNAMLRGLVAQGRIEEAIALIERMEKDGPQPDTVSYNELIRGYCKQGRLDEAMKVYGDMVKNECAPNRGTFHTLVPYLVEAGELDHAINCCHGIFSRKCRVHYSVLQVVVTALVAASRVEEATRIFELGRKNCYRQDGLMIPSSTKAGNDVKAETELDESVLYEEGSEGEKEPGNA